MDPKAGQPVDQNNLTDISELISRYYEIEPELDDPSQLVVFGTSGHRGTSLQGSFTEDHIMAITQAICDYRLNKGINGPLFIGRDTHALSTPAFKSAIQVFAGNEVTCMIDQESGYTPTPVISHAILSYNHNKKTDLADGVVITPSHNPPSDGGFKYNPPNGGPADTDATNWIASRANELLHNNNIDVKSLYFTDAIEAETTILYDYITPYVEDLKNVINMRAISQSGISICADAMGGAGAKYWHAIRKVYNLNLDIKNDKIDPTFSFMHRDHDGKTRMDCSSPYAMAGLIKLKDKYDIAFGNDPDFDRHGIVTPSSGLLNSNHYLAVAIEYLFTNRPRWKENISIGKTLVSSSMIDRIAKELDIELEEVPVGFKWFVSGLLAGSLGFGGEESAGASFLRHDGDVWSTDKDGIILALLAAEILAVTKKDPGKIYAEMTQRHGSPYYARIDVPSSYEEKQKLSKLSPKNVRVESLAGEQIDKKITHAPANGAPIGGLKVTTENGWFAARPSGTENIYKIYAESFISSEHLKIIQEEAKVIIAETLNG